MIALSAPIDLNYSKLNYTAMKHFNLLKTLLLLCALIVGSLSSWADSSTYSYTWTSGNSPSGDKALGDATWNFSYTWEGSAAFNYDGTKGQQLGTSKNPARIVTISTSSFSDKKITELHIYVSSG